MVFDTHILKTVIITLKVLLILLLLFMGLKSHLALHGRHTELTMLFIYFILTVIFYFVYEFVWPHLGLQSEVMLCLQLGQILEFRMLLNQIKHLVPTSKQNLIITLINIYIVGLFGAIIVGFTLIKDFYKCTDEHKYPLILQILMFGNIFLFAFAVFCHKTSFYANLNSESVGEEQTPILNQSIMSGRLENSQFPILSMTKSQMKWWLGF